jgi:aspartyl-tRNA(Asn)/glutamyl-tRNA(Gln) amidotransferase subunit B
LEHDEERKKIAEAGHKLLLERHTPLVRAKEMIQVLEENKKAVSDYKSGNDKAIEFLVGQILRKTKAVGNPNKIKELIKK